MKLLKNVYGKLENRFVYTKDGNPDRKAARIREEMPWPIWEGRIIAFTNKMGELNWYLVMSAMSAYRIRICSVPSEKGKSVRLAALGEIVYLSHETPDVVIYPLGYFNGVELAKVISDPMTYLYPGDVSRTVDEQELKKIRITIKDVWFNPKFLAQKARIAKAG